MVGKTYDEVAEILNECGFLPQGRYEHLQKKDSIPVIVVWINIKTNTELVFFVSINELGDLDKVTAFFRKEP